MAGWLLASPTNTGASLATGVSLPVRPTCTSIASTVVQKCIYWGTHEQCGFCGIELTRGEQTIPVKTPAQLAEVCTAARDHDHQHDDHRRDAESLRDAERGAGAAATLQPRPSSRP